MAATASRPRLAAYWATGCGGCEVGLLDLGPRLLALEGTFEVVFFPLLADGKRSTVDALPEGGIDLCLVSGALRTPHDLEMVALLRHASATLVAMGACAQLGSVQGLANLWPVHALLRAVYGDEATALGDPSSGPRPESAEIPEPAALTSHVQPLADAVRVDYTIPGCPPEPDRLWEALEVLAAAARGELEAPPRGAVLGATEAALCDECGRRRPEGGVLRFRRRHEVDPEPSSCLLDQGLVCCGPATRGGCGARCPAIGIGCRGCYGAVHGVQDQGGRMMSALAATLAVGDGTGDDARRRGAVAQALGSLVDPVGTLYRYSFAGSLLSRLRPGSGDST